MGNLIIKGKGGAGNKLILQDQAGAAVLTTADSGATIANATLVAPALGTPASGVATNLTGIPAANLTGTIGSSVGFPKGVSRDVNYLFRLQTSGTSSGGSLGGTGQQIIPFNTIKNGTEDSAFTQNILSLSSNLWTMNTGYYIWDFFRAVYNGGHVWNLGIRTYGDSSGSGSSLSNVTTDNVNFGSDFYYINAGAAHGIAVPHNGSLKVTSTNQKYGFYQYIESNAAHSTSVYTHSSTHALVQASIRFIKIGDV